MDGPRVGCLNYRLGMGTIIAGPFLAAKILGGSAGLVAALAGLIRWLGHR
jgi:hypothetical protein